jgi:hypothetical protein
MLVIALRLETSSRAVCACVADAAEKYGMSAQLHAIMGGELGIYLTIWWAQTARF